jgi:hypothetical protein
MHRIRFSLLAMFGFVAVIAVACAALARPSQLWLVIVSASLLACLFYAVLAATYGRNARRAFWLGFAVVGWGFIVLEWKNISSVAPIEFVTNRLQSVILGPTASSMGYSVSYPSPVYQTLPIDTPFVTAPPVPVNMPSVVYSTTSSYVVNTPSLTDLDPEAFRQIAMWLWSPLLGFAGGLVALRLFHRRERQDDDSPVTG